MTDTYRSPLQEVVSLALASRAQPSQRRALVKGGSKHTEHHAYPLVLPLVEKQEEDRALRLASLVASSTIPQGDLTLGQWAKGSNNSERMEAHLLQLVKLPFEASVAALQRLFVLEGQARTLNWYRVASTLYYWGDGVSEPSLKARHSILKDFYRGGSKDEAGTPAESETDND